MRACVRWWGNAHRRAPSSKRALAGVLKQILVQINPASRCTVATTECWMGCIHSKARMDSMLQKSLSGDGNLSGVGTCESGLWVSDFGFQISGTPDLNPKPLHPQLRTLYPHTVLSQIPKGLVKRSFKARGQITKSAK